jgi:hypothetical protein
MQLDDPAPAYVAVDDDNATYNDLMIWLAAQLGMPTPDVLPEPKPANKRCSNALLAASGYRFRYPSFRDGYRALLDDLPGPL